MTYQEGLEFINNNMETIIRGNPEEIREALTLFGFRVIIGRNQPLRLGKPNPNKIILVVGGHPPIVQRYIYPA